MSTNCRTLPPAKWQVDHGVFLECAQRECGQPARPAVSEAGAWQLSLARPGWNSTGGAVHGN